MPQSPMCCEASYRDVKAVEKGEHTREMENNEVENGMNHREVEGHHRVWGRRWVEQPLRRRQSVSSSAKVDWNINSGIGVLLLTAAIGVK